MLEARGLRKRFGRRQAVDGLDLTVGQGQVLGLLGPNGAGKTTTMHLLSGALRPDAGVVRVDGDEDPTKSSVRRRLGIAPQALALYPELTPRENLAFFGRLAGLHGARLAAAVDRGLALAGLEDRARDRVRTFSGGMKRRLNIACGAVHGPAVLLLDEPTVGVDPQSRNHIFEALERLKSDGIALVYSTHYMEEATRLCDRVAVVDQGRLLATGSVDELVRAHGGRARIVLRPAAPLSEASVARLTSLGFSRRDGTYELECQDPLGTITSMEGLQGPLVELSVHPPNLESVFLSLTGRALRDAS